MRNRLYDFFHCGGKGGGEVIEREIVTQVSPRNKWTAIQARGEAAMQGCRTFYLPDWISGSADKVELCYEK